MINTGVSLWLPQRYIRKSYSYTHKLVLIALNFSKVISASFPLFFTEINFPQKEKKSCSLSSVVSVANPLTWMVYPLEVAGTAGAADVEVEVMGDGAEGAGTMGFATDSPG